MEISIDDRNGNNNDNSSKMTAFVTRILFESLRAGMGD